MFVERVHYSQQKGTTQGTFYDTVEIDFFIKLNESTHNSIYFLEIYNFIFGQNSTKMNTIEVHYVCKLVKRKICTIPINYKANCTTS